MLQIVKTDDYDVWVSQLDRPFKFLAPFQGQAFALLLIVVDGTITEEEQSHLSDEIVRQGCRYAVCHGNKCSTWDDSIDFAYLATKSNNAMTDDQFVMTTWHENESLEDVVQFLRFNAWFDAFWPEHYLVLILDGESDLLDKVSSILKEWFIPMR